MLNFSQRAVDLTGMSLYKETFERNMITLSAYRSYLRDQFDFFFPLPPCPMSI